MRKLIVAFCFAAMVSPSAAFNFDQGIDLKSVGESLSAVPAEVPAAQGKYVNRRDWSRDCVRFTFSGPDLESPKIRLISRETVEECYQNPDPHAGGPVCHTTLGQTRYAVTQVKINSRELLPWESEKYDVCLEGPWLNFYERLAAYDYKVADKYVSGVNVYELAAQKKVPTPADPEGLYVISADISAASQKFVVGDKWAGYYAGDTAKITVKLKKDVPFWFDSVVVQKDFDFAPAQSYEAGFAQNLAPGKYYFEWGFRRQGAVSTGGYISRPETAAFEVK